MPDNTEQQLRERRDRMRLRAGDEAIASFNLRIDQLGRDTPEADLLREGFSYGRQHGESTYIDADSVARTESNNSRPMEHDAYPECDACEVRGSTVAKRPDGAWLCVLCADTKRRSEHGLPDRCPHGRYVALDNCYFCKPIPPSEFRGILADCQTCRKTPCQCPEDRLSSSAAYEHGRADQRDGYDGEHSPSAVEAGDSGEGATHATGSDAVGLSPPSRCACWSTTTGSRCDASGMTSAVCQLVPLLVLPRDPYTFALCAPDTEERFAQRAPNCLDPDNPECDCGPCRRMHEGRFVVTCTKCGSTIVRNGVALHAFKQTEDGPRCHPFCAEDGLGS